MKAAVINSFGGPEVFEVVDKEAPSPGPGQVLVKIHAAGINPVEYKSRKGHHKLFLGARFPIVLGYDMAGEVVATGDGVLKFKTGDLVYGRSDVKYGGTYAQYGLTSEKTLSVIPDNINFIEAAAVPLASLTALQALRDKGKIKPGDTVLVIGAAGGVGHFAVQLVNCFGAQCYAVSSYRHQEFVESLAPSAFIDYTKTDFKKTVHRYDIVFDTIGNESYRTCRKLLKKRGVYITTLPRPKLIAHKFLSLFVNGRAATLLMKSLSGDLDFIGGLIAAGKIKVHIDRVFHLDEIAKAHEYIEEGHTRGKIVIEMEHHGTAE